MRPKPVHKAARVDQHGNVSAVCFPTPRKISLALASWTLRDEAVTCRKCLKILGRTT